MTDGKTNRPDKNAWIISFDRYDPDDENRRETILALGNGMFVTRAVSTDACRDRRHYPGTYSAGCYNRLPNVIEGELDETESLVNLPNWVPLNFRIGQGPWFSIDETEILSYSHSLDLHTGTACRELVVRDTHGRCTHIRESRLVSMADPHLCAIQFELTPWDWSGKIEIRSALEGQVSNTNVARYQDYQHHHLVSVEPSTLPNGALMLRSRTSRSGIEIAQTMYTRCSGENAHSETIADPGKLSSCQLIRVEAKAGETLTVEKIASLCTSCEALINDVPQAAQAALQRADCYDAMFEQHKRAWSNLWSRVAIDMEESNIARTLRLHAFHILQTISPHTIGLDAGVPARGWHGEAYHGHVFWDELFVLPFLNYRFPELVKEALLYRYRRLDSARDAARQAGYKGAMYPWRSASDGSEVTPRHQKNMLTGQWMHDHTYLQRHIGSAIAFNCWNYYLSTGDEAFLEECGAEMMLEIARFWASIAHLSTNSGRFEIRGVIGPDEYHNAYPDRTTPGLDNNAYTNVMAAWSLCRALDVLALLPAPRCAEIRRQLDLTNEELDLWERISRNLLVPFHGDKIISQFQEFEQLSEFSLEMLPSALANERIDWALGAIGKSTDEFQVTKQADALMLFYLFPEHEVIGLFDRLGYEFDQDSIYRTAIYYLARTTHRSSLSYVVYAGALAQVDPALSWKLYVQVLNTDLNPLKAESIAEGIHLGAMGGSIDILQRRYLGISACADGLHIDPALPMELGNFSVRLLYRNNSLHVEIKDGAMQIRSENSNRTEIKIINKGNLKNLQPGDSICIPWGA